MKFLNYKQTNKNRVHFSIDEASKNAAFWTPSFYFSLNELDNVSNTDN
jgi:hypothetical protein